MRPYWYQYPVIKRVVLSSVGATIVCFNSINTSTFAQITADGTVSTNVISSDNLNFVIENGEVCCIHTDQREDIYLFHSFDAFSVPTGGTAHFNNATAIDIIFSRVTGDSKSIIDGRLSANGTANVFLLNPHGIIFGENASLDIGGSFIGTTAESLVFEDGSEFSTTALSSTPLLNISGPLGLQMGQNPGNILQSEATLETSAGRTLALVGGNITIAGGIMEVPGGRGRIELISLGADSVANLRSVGEKWRIDIADAASFANLTLDEALIQGSGNGNSAIQLVGHAIRATNSQVQSSNLGGRQGQGIAIRSDRLFQADNSDFTLEVQSGGDTGNVTITAPVTQFINNGGVGNIVTQGSTGNGGNLLIRGNRFTVANNSGFGVWTAGSGNSGDVVIDVEEVSIRDNSGFGVFTTDTGNSGDVTIQGSRMMTTNESGGGMFTEGKGAAGNLNIFVDTFLLTGSSGYSLRSIGTGNAGNVRINSNVIVIRDESGFSTSTRGSSTGGDITIQAQEITLDTAQINALTDGTETAGNLNIVTDTLRLTNGGQLNVFTSSDAKAGKINVIARDRIIISGRDRAFATRETEDEQDALVSPFSGIFGNTLDSAGGNGGDVTITTPYLHMEGNARISVSAEGDGDAGALSLNGHTALLQQASIQSEATAGSGGDLLLNLDRALFMTRQSRITTNANKDGGNITIQSPISIVGLYNSDIIANAVEGDGGNIRIGTQGLFGFRLGDAASTESNFTSDLTASSERGVNGTITISNFNWEPDSGIVALPTNLEEASERIGQGCSFMRKSKFILTGRGGLPSRPLGETSGDRPWFNILPDFGAIPDTNAPPSSVPDNISLQRPSPIAATPTQQFFEERADVPTEATEMAIAPDGTRHLINANIHNATRPYSTCISQSAI
ncbi:MAG: S-layer family protein [Cyanobacteria bacterium P01_F01_bin.150]